MSWLPAMVFPLSRWVLADQASCITPAHDRITCPVVELKRWLQFLEPSILTDGNLATMVKRGQTLAAVERLCPRLEYMTRMPPYAPVFPDVCDEPAYRKFLAHLAELNAANGWLARDSAIPTDWASSPAARSFALTAPT